MTKILHTYYGKNWGVTGNMQIIPHENTIEIWLDAEQNLTPSMVKRKLPPLLAETSTIEETN
jgi:hypothetical protein